MSVLNSLVCENLKFLQIMGDSACGKYGVDDFRVKVNYRTRIISIEYRTNRSDMIMTVFVHIRLANNACMYMGDLSSLEGYQAFMVASMIHMHIFGDILGLPMVPAHFPEVGLDF